jgi:hypothetical protein
MRLHRAVLALGICAAGCAGVQEDMPVTPSKSAAPKVDVENKRIELPGLIIHRQARYVDVAARVCLREGTLELVACTRAGKVHESIISVDARPAHIHTALLLLGANPGNPAMRKRDADRWVDVPPRGSAIDVFLLYEDESGKQIERPIRDFITRAGVEPAEAKRKANRFPTHTFLFAGSCVVDWREGNKPYVCDLSGNVISLSTFGDEVLCLPGVHGHANAALLWQVDPTHLPALETKLTLRLRPHNGGKEKKGGGR